jgi:hypothetical protein
MLKECVMRQAHLGPERTWHGLQRSATVGPGHLCRGWVARPPMGGVDAGADMRKGEVQMPRMRRLPILGLRQMLAGGGQLLSGPDTSAGPDPSAMPPRAYDHGRGTDMKSRTFIGGIFALLWLMALPAWAVEYRLQVANLDVQLFSSYEGHGTSWGSQKAPMGRLEARLDQQQLSPAAVLPGHHVDLLEDPSYGGTTPTRVSLLPATGRQDWTTYVFDANPGDTVAFVVRTDTHAWQEIWDVAANPDGTFRWLSIGGPGIFGNASREVPQVS